MTGEECRPLLDDDGQVIASVRGRHPLSPEAEDAMRELVAAARRKMDADDPDGTLGERQQTAIARIRARVARRHAEQDPPMSGV